MGCSFAIKEGGEAPMTSTVPCEAFWSVVFAIKECGEASMTFTVFWEALWGIVSRLNNMDMFL